MGVYRVGIAYILLGGLGFIMLTAGMILVRFDYIFIRKSQSELLEELPKILNKKLKHTQKTYKEKAADEKYLRYSL